MAKKTFVPLLLAAAFSLAAISSDAATGWLNWRGPHQSGVSDETGLADTWEPGGTNDLWTYDIKGRGSPVVADGRLYVFGYDGEGPDLQEYLVCLNADTGKEIWKRGFNDFLSDIVYNRYSIGSPTVDAETGNIFLMTTPGLLMCFNPDGDILWRYSMMERFGRMTFPNGRTGAAVIDDDLVIVHGITSYWGADGPARDRFFAFDKNSGALVWTSTPGVRPHDSSFSTPWLGWENGKRVLYAGTGCGNMVCVNVRTGEPIWRFQMARGGVNSSALKYKDMIIAIHGKENLDSSETGRMVAIKTGAQPKPGEKGPVVLDKSYEVWRNPLLMFTSSPVLVGNRVYQVDHTGVLNCVDADTGKILWTLKLSNNQLHASPLYADGKLYIPFREGEGETTEPSCLFYIIKPKEDGADILCKTTLEGNGLGSPIVWNGKIYVHTTAKLYCFGKKEGKPVVVKPEERKMKPGKAVALQVVPEDVLLDPGEKQDLRIREIDANGNVVKEAVHAKIASYIPPTAKVKAKMDATIDGNAIVAPKDAKISAGAFKAEADGLSGIFRGRVLPSLPYAEDFNSFNLSVPHATEKGVNFAYPPLPWIGARFKWEIRDVNGEKALAKTLDNVLFQRAITFIGDPDLSNYTVQADVMTDGNRRMMSNVGVINQHYVIELIGNWRQLEVNSNQSRVKVGVPFNVKPKTWYTIKSRVDVAADGSGVVRGKAWPREEAEPDAWTIEVPHKIAHKQGAPGIFGFSPQSRFRVYVDNIKVTSND